MSHIKDPFQTVRSLSVNGRDYAYHSLDALAESGFPNVRRFPLSMRILLESVLRNCDGTVVTEDHVKELAAYDPASPGNIETPFQPARVLLQDFTGVPCVVDLAAMRSAMARMGGEPKTINPKLKVDLVIDHSVQVDVFNSPDALKQNAEIEFRRNRERYEFLRWGQRALENFSVVPPASGICHQVNLEYLGKVVQIDESGDKPIAYADSLVGTDSHTPMINGLGVLGWGVGGIEAEAAMLGRPIFMLAPAVVGVRLSGSPRPGTTATDLVLTVTEMLRKHGVVGKFVEFFGAGLASMTVPDRATISNMAPEYGATIGYFPVDQQTLDYLYATGRPENLIALVEAFAKAQGIYRADAADSTTAAPQYEMALELDLSTVEPSVAGPKRPQDRISLANLKDEWAKVLRAPVKDRGFAVSEADTTTKATVSLKNGEVFDLTHGDVAIAAITSCTNTSNPSVLLGAGILAKKAVERGLTKKPAVKTSFAPGSLVVTEYLIRAGLMEYLEKLGFYLVGYGCTTCIGNSGPLPEEIARAITDNSIVAAGVLSGNRNFEGRINPHTQANFLASPPLVVAYALAGTVDIDLTKDPIGRDNNGKPVYLADVWPTRAELDQYVKTALDRDAFIESYSGLEESNPEWNKIELSGSDLYPWSDKSSYVQEPPFFVGMSKEVAEIRPIEAARVLVVAGDSTTTDHISPAGPIDPDSPAGRYLQERGIAVTDFNSYGSRRGNDRVMVRGTFANIRFRNQLTPETEGSSTIYHPTGEKTSIFDAAMRYKDEGTPVIVLAGKDYGMGSSRDWAAKGVSLLGVRAVIAESYERIHRSNLVGMGVLPLQFEEGQSRETLGLTGKETFLINVDEALTPKQLVGVVAVDEADKKTEFKALCRVDSPVEVDYYKNGGILHAVLRRFAAESRA